MAGPCPGSTILLCGVLSIAAARTALAMQRIRGNWRPHAPMSAAGLQIYPVRGSCLPAPAPSASARRAGDAGTGTRLAWATVPPSRAATATLRTNCIRMN